MHRSILSLAAMLLMSAAPLAHADNARHHTFRVRTHLSGYNEVHLVQGPPVAIRGAVSTTASGKFVADIDKANNIIRYQLSYKKLEGGVTQAHIHFGQRHTVGGIVVWLCQTAGTPAPASVAAVTPVCPSEGTVTGTIEPAQVLAQTAQGIEAGAFAELVRAIRAGAAYANVHTTLFPPGEIRGQLPESDGD